MEHFCQYLIYFKNRRPIVVETIEGKAFAIYIHHPEKPGIMKPLKVLRINE